MNTDAFPTPSIEYEYVWMKKSVFLAVVGLDGLAFLFCVFCAFAIIFYRRHLTIANAGLPLTHVFIAGCVLILMSVPLFGIDSNLTDKISIPKACMVRIWLFSVGYSLSVGIMIVRIIYTAFMELVREFKDYQISSFVILIFVSSMAIMDTIILIAWRCRSPPYKEYVTKEVEYIGLRDERRTLVETCSSEKGSVVLGFLCFYKGGLLLVASIISIFKREEAQKRSLDYNQCKLVLLSVLVAGAVGLPVALSLQNNPNERFTVGGLVVILEVVFLMIWVNAFKVFKAHKCKNGEALEFGKYLVESSRSLPCVRPVYGCVYDVKTQGMFNHGYADLDSMFDVKDAESVKEADEGDTLEDIIGFDCKVSEDILPDGLPSHDEYDMTPYNPDAEEEQKVEKEQTDDEASDKPDGETSDDDSSSSDDESSGEDVSSSSAIARSAVTLHLDKSTAGSCHSLKKDMQSVESSSQSIKKNNQETEIEQERKNSSPEPAENRPETAKSDKRRWWKPLFGGKNKSEKPAKAIHPVENNVPITPASENNSNAESESSESESEDDTGPKRCQTPHGGSTTEFSDSGSDSD